jgi:hypothetical protein
MLGRISMAVTTVQQQMSVYPKYGSKGGGKTLLLVQTEAVLFWTAATGPIQTTGMYAEMCCQIIPNGVVRLIAAALDAVAHRTAFPKAALTNRKGHVE